MPGWCSSSVLYNYINLDMGTGEHKSERYTATNPNGRLSTIVYVKEDGTSVTVFESGACLLYLANEFDKEHKLSYPFATPESWAQLSWVGAAGRPVCFGKAEQLQF